MTEPWPEALVEKVARAIAKRDGDDDDERERPLYRSLARAALDASGLREAQQLAISHALKIMALQAESSFMPNRDKLKIPAKEIPLELKLSAWEWEKLLWALLAINPQESRRAQGELERLERGLKGE